ncbi:MAG: DNA repair protein RecO C-terminal domain-containing protein, partial [Bacteroidales bacterium]|nr:DNA repair protein RecO C-terminal domain-containing protein [Bacteroidales bacterium]
NKNFQQIKEVKINPVLHSLSNNIIKNSISLFLAELLYRLIKEEEPNKQLFEYIFNSIILLDQLDKNIINFHLFFMVHLTRYIGFLPDNNYSSSKVYFDLLNGKFFSSLPSHNHYLTKEQSFLLSKILSHQGNDYEIKGMNNSYRSDLLEKIIEYYQIHLEGFSNIKSLEVFKEIFN